MMQCKGASRISGIQSRVSVSNLSFVLRSTKETMFASVCVQLLFLTDTPLLNKLISRHKVMYLQVCS
jgi:hypothetical protein